MYRAIVYWFDGDEERKDFMFVCADSYLDAIKKISFELSYINRIDIELISSDNTGIVYVPEECHTKIKQTNTF